MRVFVLRVEIQEGSDEFWEELGELPLTDAAERLREYLQIGIDDHMLQNTKVDLIGARQDADW